ncbi:MAG TPA: hypothetical protein VM452_15075 [Caulifigura sp.]|jgi:hypothetical protein|nr:hypothetical protein [Caulifigura sp.]
MRCSIPNLFRSKRAMLLAVLALAASGCSTEAAGPERFPVAGTVTFNGQPVPFGDIQFIPDTKKGNNGPAGFATITDGKFDTATKGRGVVGGPHEVVINGTATPPVVDENAKSNVPLFPEFRAKHDLPKEASSLDFKIPPSSAR